MLLVATAILLASCDANVDAATTAALTSRLCTLEDLGGGYLHQTDGDFFPQDLAALPDAPDGRLKALREAGFVRGRLIYWKASVEKPPFDPPVSVYCQVMQFSTTAQAASFSAGLAPAREDLETAGLTFLPSESLQIAEGSPSEGVRVFTIRGNDGWNVVAAVEPAGRYVVSVYTGGRGAAVDPSAAVTVLRTVQSHSLGE